jgi:hypothetical protein
VFPGLHEVFHFGQFVAASEERLDIFGAQVYMAVRNIGDYRAFRPL